MLTFLRSRWRQISTGILALTLLGAGSTQVYRAMRGDCCAPGSPCCYPGSPCCHHAPPGK
jgi:hypothetical protein